MCPAPLPDDATTAQLAKLAEDLRDLATTGDAGVLDLIGRHHPDGPHAVSLDGARLVLARNHGFEDWDALARHLDLVAEYRRQPDEVDVDEATGSPVDRFLALACLRYGGDDGPERWAAARRLLAEHPGITSASAHAAAAAADQAALRDVLRGRPSAANEEGGPYRWQPVLYLAFARHDPDIAEAALLATARLLLEHGADPNAGYLWHGLIPPFTALTGALGSGEGGDEQQPEHPHGMALARLLLEAGADPNDGQALYNRQFGDDDSHLVLLAEHGLGRGDGGPWRARLGHRQDSPAEMLRGQLWWAIVHGKQGRVALLVEHGADVRTPYEAPGGRPSGLRTSHGHTPAELAALSGWPELARWLVASGADPPALEGPGAFVAAVLAGDAAAVEAHRNQAAVAQDRRPALVVWAAAHGRLDAVRRLVELGFDVNALGRSDVPLDQPWQTALHDAAGNGDLAMIRLLLELGADPTMEDARFSSTPPGWAEHFGRHEAAELLRAASPPPTTVVG